MPGGSPFGFTAHQDNPLKAQRPLSFRLLFPFFEGELSEEVWQ